MAELRVLCRVVTYDPNTRSILLVRNKGQQWWCAPGGGWDFATETIQACASREVHEETGITVKILKFLYCQTLYLQQKASTWLEQFWLAEPDGPVVIPQGHIDHFGIVDEARWFTQSEVQAITVYPPVLQTSFWNDLSKITQEEDRYLGHTVL